MALQTPDEAVEITRTKMWPLLRAEQSRVARIDKWMRWDHDDPYKPRAATREYRDLASRAQAPWGRRVVGAVCDQLYVEGFRAAKATDNAAPWEWWQANGWDARQIAINEATVGYGLAYAVVLPGKSWLGEKMPVMRGLDPSQMVTVYEDPAWDDWPEYALRAIPIKVGDRQGWRLRLFDDQQTWNLGCSSEGKIISTDAPLAHGLGVCPVVRYTNHLDLRGRADGDVEPIIPLLGRIDQTTFDRLIVQRFASWKVRFVTGMALAESAALAGVSVEEAKQRLQVNDMLVAEDPAAHFGTLDHTPLDGFIAAHDADIRELAAVSQTPAHELIGQMANMSAEALAAAEASLTRRAVRVRHAIGESHEQTLRLAALVMGDSESARDVSTQVHWADMESRSLAQAADALGKLAQMLKVPVELLWEKIPGWTQEDVERAKAIVTEGGPLEQLLAELAKGDQPPMPAPVPAAA